MKIITPQTLANEAAERFKENHCINGNWRPDSTYLPKGAADYESVYEQLAALGPTPDPQDVARLIHRSWIEPPRCDCCIELSDLIVELAKDDEQQVVLCERCIRLAIRAIEETAAYSNIRE